MSSNNQTQPSDKATHGRSSTGSAHRDTGSGETPQGSAGHSPPSISLPKGGGAIRDIEEKFDVSAPTGTGSMVIPIPTSKGRSAVRPELSLSYSSGNGNSPFGLGWDVSAPSISRKTDKGLPQYRDGASDAESDVYMAGGEDLVPIFKYDAQGAVVLDSAGSPVVDEKTYNGFNIRTYRPRVETDFHRVERWTLLDDPGQIHWRTTTKDNVTSIYGSGDNSRVFDPTSEVKCIFRWLIAETYDVDGNAMTFVYKSEDSSGIPHSAHEENRDPQTRSANRYLKVIKYGNRSPNRDPITWAATSAFSLPTQDWTFSVVFDYGEHDISKPTPAETTMWSYRRDPFSNHRSGFEIRTYRLCRRILMFHHFAELPQTDYLVRSTNLAYDENPFTSFLTQVTQVGYVYDPTQSKYASRPFPPIDLAYSRFPTDDELSRLLVQDIDPESLQNLPIGVDGTIYQWMDLDGEGSSGILVEQGPDWYYKENLSSLTSNDKMVPRFEVAELIDPKPAGTIAESQLRFLSLAGDRRLDVVDMRHGSWGFYERTSEKEWSSYRTLPTFPNIDVSGPGVRFVDVTGDGLADIIVSEDQVFTFYPSLGYSRYGPGICVPKTPDGDTGGRLIFEDPELTIYLVDMSGSGLSDLLRVQNGDICYWPNLGYGRFGLKVRMDNAPWFARIDEFNQKNIHIADVDGSGTSDILYLDSHGVDIYLNQSGNGFSDRKRLQGFPQTENLSTIRTVDLMGTGTICLVWTSPLPDNARSCMKYVDLMQGVKPNLLTRSVNNLGAETRIHYTPSTTFYQADKLAGKPWVTRLPFPVHCVKKLEIFDHVSQHHFVSTFAYHDGYFDGFEREFRGFAMVEQWDSEDFETMTKNPIIPSNAANLDPTWHVPPVYTKTWFHTGTYINNDKISQHLAHQYFGAPLATDTQGFAKFATTLLDDTVLPPGLDIGSAREACRSLKGHVLRKEIYSADKGPKAVLPYAVTESNFTVEVLQRQQDSHFHSVCTVHPRETITYQFERNIDDPRISHELTLQVDPFGNILKAIRVAYGRMPTKSPLTGADQTIQELSILTYNETDVSNAVIDVDNYLLPRQAELRSYQLHGFQVQAGASRFHLGDFVKDDFSPLLGLPEIPYEATATRHPKAKRLFVRKRTLYRSKDLSQLLPVGQIDFMGLQGESYQLALTPGLIDGVYKRTKRDGSTENLLLAPTQILGGKGGDQGGYVDLDSNGNWWAPSGRCYFHQESSASWQQELSEARSHFFRERRFTDAYGQNTLADYDAYDLLLTKITDPVNNTTQAHNDYRVLQPDLVTDPNSNRSQCAFDELGQVVGIALMGKTTQDIGDNLIGFQPVLSSDQIDQFVANPKGPIAATLLGNATTRIIENISRFWLEPDAMKKLPSFVATLSRETHTADSSSGPLKIQVTFSYYDGFGREVQKKIQAEPGAVADGGPIINPRWIGSGWRIFNNKNKPVKEFEPFFDASHEFRFDNQAGVSSTLFYDPLDRVVGTLHPNHTWSKSVFDPWQHITFDENDTVLLNAKTDPDIGHFFQSLPDAEYQPSWYEARNNGQRGPEEESASAKAAAHSNTPTVVWLDSLNRPFLTVIDNGPSMRYPTRTTLDINSNALEVVDPMGRVAEQSVYDMLNNRIHGASMDSGGRWIVFDVSCKPIYQWDSRDQLIRSVHDPLRRDLESNLQQSRRSEIKMWMKVYGDSQQDGAAHNRRGKVFQTFDQAGVETHLDYDFKGNLLHHQRQFALKYKANLDWSGPVHLVATTYLSQTQYDALNRVTQLTAADTTVTLNSYNEGNQLQQVKSNLSGEEANGQPVWTTFILDIDYNAKGQRTLVQHGNGVSTTYTYDPKTFRLIQIQTRRESVALQNLNYFYDPVGNITRIGDNAQQTLYFRNQIVDPSSDYTYDPIYRLTQAIGREHLGQINGQIGGPTPPAPIDKFHTRLDQPGDGNAMGTYTESYNYDSVGNILSLKHAGSDAANPWWTRIYTYNEMSQIEATELSNRLSSTTIGSSSAAYNYDQHGNMTLPHLSRIDWDYKDRLRATAKQTVTNGGTSETTWYVYDSNDARVRKVTERYAPAGEAPARLNDRIYLENYEKYREYGGDGIAVILERDSLHIIDDKERVAIMDIRTVGDEPLVPQKLFRYQFSSILDSVSLELDDRAQIISYEEYTPFGSTSYRAVRSQTETPKRYAFTGKEHDEENGLYYHGARYYACWLGRWISTDPSLCHTEHSDSRPDEIAHTDSAGKKSEHHSSCCSPYVYVDNCPTVNIDPDGRDAVYIAFPDYKISTPIGKVEHLGHAGVLLINNKTGETKYYEYGRYDKAGKGLVQTRTVPNVKMGADGNSTPASLDAALAVLSAKAGQGGRIEGAYIHSDKFKEMNDYAKKKLAENSDPDRKTYGLLGNNCGTFASDVVKQDPSVSHPWFISNPTPINIVDEYQEEGHSKVQFVPPTPKKAAPHPPAPKSTPNPGKKKEHKKTPGRQPTSRPPKPKSRH